MYRKVRCCLVSLDRLKSLAKKKGIKLGKLFEMVGRKEWYGGDIKKGAPVPDSYIEVWADALDTSAAYLLGETDDPSPEKKKGYPIVDGIAYSDQDIIEMIKKLGPEDMDALRILLKRMTAENK